MKRKEFIDILEKERVQYSLDAVGNVHVKGSGILYSHAAFVVPDTSFTKYFRTKADFPIPLEDLRAEQLTDMIEHYRKNLPSRAEVMAGMANLAADRLRRLTELERENGTLKAENERLKAVLERHGIKLLK